MPEHTLRKGKNIRLKGEAKKEIKTLPLPKKIAIQPPDFKGFRARLNVKEGHDVKVGTPVIESKEDETIKVVSPIAGKVVAINRGDKRALLQIVIEASENQETEKFESYSKDQISSLNKDQIQNNLLKSGLWNVIRQRPFSKIANPQEAPKSIFVHAMSTDPLAADVDFILQGKEDLFQTGLDLISKLTEGSTYLCVDYKAKSKALTSSKNVEIHKFSGPHPTGNVSTHIHAVDPINKGEIVWYLEAQDVLRVAELFLTGVYPTKRVVAVTGEGAKDRCYYDTIVGAPVEDLLNGKDFSKERIISGSVLSGTTTSIDGFVSYYDSQLTIIPEGGNRELLGWILPGFKKYSFTRTFMSALGGEQTDVSLDTDENGGHRAIVFNQIYDELVSLDIMVYFLIKAVVSGDIEEAENLGILECDREDFALCTFACPSKVDVGAIIQKGLDTIELEG